MENKLIRIDDLEFEYATSGSPDNPAVMLLHGFPESNIMWKQLMLDLSEAGFYCIAPNMRGYSPNARPKGVDNYHSDHLIADAIGIADELSLDQFHLIAHDWGSLVGWGLVHDHRDRILTWTSLSIPHPKAMIKAIQTDKVQKKKSRYILFFMLRWFPETYLLMFGGKNLKKVWYASSQEEKTDYWRLLGNRSGLGSALNYYRANFKSGKSKKTGPTNLPTTLIWGNRDLAVSRTAAEACHKYVGEEFSFHELDAGHWLMQKAYDQTADLIKTRLKG